MTLTNKEINAINELAYNLSGSCNSLYLDEWIQDNNLAPEKEIEYMEELDQLVLLCTMCGWWVEVDEITENNDGQLVCNDCAEYGDE